MERKDHEHCFKLLKSEMWQRDLLRVQNENQWAEDLDSMIISIFCYSELLGSSEALVCQGPTEQGSLGPLLGCWLEAWGPGTSVISSKAAV